MSTIPCLSLLDIAEMHLRTAFIVFHGGNQYENYVVGLFKLYAPHRVSGVGRNSCYAGSVQAKGAVTLFKLAALAMCEERALADKLCGTCLPVLL